LGSADQDISEKDGQAPRINGETVLNSLLSLLSDGSMTTENISKAAAVYFDRSPHDTRRDQLLLKLVEKDEAAWDVVWTIVKNYDTLPEDVRGLLYTLAGKNSKAADGVAVAVADNYDSLPEKARILLLILAENAETAGGVAWAIIRNYNKLPDHVQELLFTIAEKDVATLAGALACNYTTLPDNVQKLLFTLAEKDAKTVRFAVNYYADKLPKDVFDALKGY